MSDSREHGRRGSLGAVGILLVAAVLVAATAKESEPVVNTCPEPRPTFCPKTRYDFPVCAARAQDLDSPKSGAPRQALRWSTYRSPCHACIDPAVVGYTSGACGSMHA